MISFILLRCAFLSGSTEYSTRKSFFTSMLFKPSIMRRCPLHEIHLYPSPRYFSIIEHLLLDSTMSSFCEVFVFFGGIQYINKSLLFMYFYNLIVRRRSRRHTKGNDQRRLRRPYSTNVYRLKGGRKLS